MNHRDISQPNLVGITGATQRREVVLSSATLNAVENTRAEAEIKTAKKSKRIPALDFTKGALVLIMVLYHWMNYFVTADGSVYKYLRFLTPSFIFITGFLISQVYLSKFQTSGSPVPRRLLVRGLKLLAIVFCLNLGQGTARIKTFESQVGNWPLGKIALAYLSGIAPIAFSILIPIAYLLILSAGLMLVSRRYRNIFHISCAVFVICALVAELKGIKTGYLQLFSIGMLGISVGYIPMDRINRLVRRPVVLFVSYLAYLCAITVWDDSYTTQIVGVCLSLAILYWIGGDGEPGRIRQVFILLGQYSLFGYIVQIVILQILRRSLGHFGSGLSRVGDRIASLCCWYDPERRIVGSCPRQKRRLE